MSYEIANSVPCEGAEDLKTPIAPLSGVLDQANNMATEALVMARRIKRYMLGIDKSTDDKAKPQCFRDALEIQRITINEVVEELASIMDGLGV